MGASRGHEAKILLSEDGQNQRRERAQQHTDTQPDPAVPPRMQTWIRAVRCWPLVEDAIQETLSLRLAPPNLLHFLNIPSYRALARLVTLWSAWAGQTDGLLRNRRQGVA